MKVLLVITGLSMGGAEKVVTDLADALVKAGCQVMLVYLKQPLQVRPRQDAVAMVCLDMDSAAAALPGYLRFRRIVQDFKPDIVHAHMFHASLLARLARLSMPIASVVSTMHTAYDGGRLRALAYRLTDRLTDISTNVSCEAVEAFTTGGAVRAGRMVAIHNGICVDEFQRSQDARTKVRAAFAIDEGCRLFVAAGRLDWSKDYPNLFQALARLPRDLRYTLLVAGEGPLRPELEAQVAALGLGARVRFLGIRHDIPELMAAADVFVLSSVGEGFGLVVAEAMACECVVVATDSGGVREVLGDAGFLVPSRDPAALAAALLAATSLSSETAAGIGSAARRRVVAMYSFARAVDRWRELYASLLAGAGEPLSQPRSAS